MNTYSSTNTENFKYYIYAYIRKDGTPYYIGKGSGDRAFRKNKIDRMPAPKNKSQIIIMENNLSEVGALALERRIIRWYGRKDNNTGILRNLTDGGEGGTGTKFTEEHKRKISEARKRNWAHNTKLREKMSILNKGNTYGKARKGWQPNDITRKRMSESAKKKKKEYVSCDLCHEILLKNNVIIHNHKRIVHHIL